MYLYYCCYGYLYEYTTCWWCGKISLLFHKTRVRRCTENLILHWLVCEWMRRYCMGGSKLALPHEVSHLLCACSWPYLSSCWVSFGSPFYLQTLLPGVPRHWRFPPASGGHPPMLLLPFGRVGFIAWRLRHPE